MSATPSNVESFFGSPHGAEQPMLSTCPPDVLQDLLAILTEEQQQGSTEAQKAKESAAIDSAASDTTQTPTHHGTTPQATHIETSMGTPSPPLSPRNKSILTQVWQPCTGKHRNIGHYLDEQFFPVSYRKLVAQWTEAGRPHLQTLRTPLSLRSFKSPSLDLQSITEAQERMVIDALHGYFDRGFVPQPQLFVGFASHLDIYCAVHAELCEIKDGTSALQTYEDTWRAMLEAFDVDRSACAVLASHDCLGYMLWGEMYSWPKTEIQRRFELYKSRSSAMPQLQPLTPSSSYLADLGVRSAPVTPLRSNFYLPFASPPPLTHTSSWPSLPTVNYSPMQADCSSSSSSSSSTPTLSLWPYALEDSMVKHDDTANWQAGLQTPYTTPLISTDSLWSSAMLPTSPTFWMQPSEHAMFDGSNNAGAFQPYACASESAGTEACESALLNAAGMLDRAARILQNAKTASSMHLNAAAAAEGDAPRPRHHRRSYTISGGGAASQSSFSPVHTREFSK